MDLRELIKTEILNQTAYAIDLSDCPIKLDANENPHDLPPAVRDRLHGALRAVSLNRYPDPEARELKAGLSRQLGVPADWIMVGNGSDELIQILLTAIRVRPGGGVLIPVPTFAMYRIMAVNLGHRVIEMPLDGSFDLPVDAGSRWVAGETPDITFLSYPNNPTGNCFSRARVAEILDTAKGLVVVDEAYFHFSGDTFLPEVRERENLVILRTFSKLGFAALRLGVLVGAPDLLRELNKVRLPYNLNALTQTVGTALLDHGEELDRQVRDIVAERKLLFEELKRIPGIKPWPSDANFILFSCDLDKDRLYKILVERGILVKAFSAPEALRRCLRVSVGKKEENRLFIETLRHAAGVPE
ncbi:MAG TPA: histidinol-phosphate transaminase [Syntrophales bacterium]|nr:histidinol-phosphate transaminase [Syntrophales bacterium]